MTRRVTAWQWQCLMVIAITTISSALAVNLWSIPSTTIGNVENVAISFGNGVVTLATSSDTNKAGVYQISLESGKIASVTTLADERGQNYSMYNVARFQDNQYEYLAVGGFAGNNSKTSTIAMWFEGDLKAKPKWVHKFEGAVYGGTQAMKMASEGYWAFDDYVGYSYLHTLGDTRQRTPMQGGSRWLVIQTGELRGQANLESTLGEVYTGGYWLMDREYDGDVNMFTLRGLPSGTVKAELMLTTRTLVRVSLNKYQPYIFYVSDVSPRTISEYSLNDKKFTFNYSVGANEEWLELACVLQGRDHEVAVSWDSNSPATGYRVRVFGYSRTVFYNALIAAPSKSSVAPIAKIIENSPTQTTTTTTRDLMIGIPGQGVYYVSLKEYDRDPAAPRLVFPYDDACGFASIELGRSARGVVGVAVVNKREGIRNCRAKVAVNAFTA